jgi:pimeloyl-ACP methyl ester carboxylesterase
VASLLYLPGTNMNGVKALPDEDHNLWIFLARRGVEVYTLDYRTHALPAGGTIDPAVMRGWDLDAFVGDIQAAAAKARAESGRRRLFVAGFSRGVSLAYAYAASEPDAVGGLVLLDGAFKSHAPKDTYQHAAELKKLEASGAWASDVSGRMGWEGRQKLMQAAAADPAGPAGDPRFASIGEQLSEILFSAWRPGGLANAKGGMSKPQVLARLLLGYDRYYPAVQTLDGQSIADRADDPRTPIDDLWGEMKTPILNFTGTGMGGDFLLNSIYSADKSGSQDVTLHVLERYGHLDVIVGERARAEVFEPALAWIVSRAGQR